MKMIDVGAKPLTERVAVASAFIQMKPSTQRLIKSGAAQKGDVLAAAKLAAVMAAKKTPDIVPLCHPIAISSVDSEIQFKKGGISIAVTVKTVERTGVEMEAMLAAAAAALTIYDMTKSYDRGMVIERVQLEEKRGGRSGIWQRSKKKV